MLRNLFLAIGVTLFAASAAWAQCKASSEATAKAVSDGGAKPACCSADAAGAGKCSSARAAACKAGAPCMKYTVGDKSTCCPEEAAKLAGGDKSKITYVVGDRTFSDETEAKKALAAALDAYLTEMTTVKFAVGEKCLACPIEAASLARKEGQPVRYRLATFDFSSQEAAEKAAAAAKEAASSIKLGWKVGEKSFCCAAMAGDAAKKEGQPVQFCVGEKSTNCEVTASVDLALARIEAALAAIEKAQQG